MEEDITFYGAVQFEIKWCYQLCYFWKWIFTLMYKNLWVTRCNVPRAYEIIAKKANWIKIWIRN